MVNARIQLVLAGLATLVNLCESRAGIFHNSEEGWEIREQAIHRPKVAVARPEMQTVVNQCVGEVKDQAVKLLGSSLRNEGFTVGEALFTVQESFVVSPRWRDRVRVVPPRISDKSYEIVRNEFAKVLRVTLPVQKAGTASQVQLDLPLNILGTVSRVVEGTRYTQKGVKDVTHLRVAPMIGRSEGVAIPETATVLDTHVDERPVTLQLKSSTGSDLAAFLKDVRCDREIERLPADLSEDQRAAARQALKRKQSPLPAIYRAMTPGGHSERRDSSGNPAETTASAE